MRDRYGITVEQYEAMLEQQGGVCAVCGRSDLEFHIDHDHSTGVVRGVLCGLCNKGLGQFKDSPDLLEAAAAYLRRQSACVVIH